MSMRNLEEKTNTQNTDFKKYNLATSESNQNQNILKVNSEAKRVNDQEKLTSW